MTPTRYNRSRQAKVSVPATPRVTRVKSKAQRGKQDTAPTVASLIEQMNDKIKSLELQLTEMKQTLDYIGPLKDHIASLDYICNPSGKLDPAQMNRVRQLISCIASEAHERTRRLKNAIVFNIPDKLNLAKVRATLMNACNMTNVECKCLRLNKKTPKRCCPILFKFSLEEHAHHFMQSQLAITQHTPFKDVLVKPDRTPLERSPSDPTPRTPRAETTCSPTLQLITRDDGILDRTTSCVEVDNDNASPGVVTSIAFASGSGTTPQSRSVKKSFTSNTEASFLMESDTPYIAPMARPQPGEHSVSKGPNTKKRTSRKSQATRTSDLLTNGNKVPSQTDISFAVMTSAYEDSPNSRSSNSFHATCNKTPQTRNTTYHTSKTETRRNYLLDKPTHRYPAFVNNTRNINDSRKNWTMLPSASPETYAGTHTPPVSFDHFLGDVGMASQPFPTIAHPADTNFMAQLFLQFIQMTRLAQYHSNQSFHPAPHHLPYSNFRQNSQGMHCPYLRTS